MQYFPGQSTSSAINLNLSWVYKAAYDYGEEQGQGHYRQRATCLHRPPSESCIAVVGRGSCKSGLSKEWDSDHMPKLHSSYAKVRCFYIQTPPFSFQARNLTTGGQGPIPDKKEGCVWLVGVLLEDSPKGQMQRLGGTHLDHGPRIRGSEPCGCGFQGKQDKK